MEAYEENGVATRQLRFVVPLFQSRDRIVGKIGPKNEAFIYQSQSSVFAAMVQVYSLLARM